MDVRVCCCIIDVPLKLQSGVVILCTCVVCVYVCVCARVCVCACVCVCCETLDVAPLRTVSQSLIFFNVCTTHIICAIISTSASNYISNVSACASDYMNNIKKKKNMVP